jgi:hypothetical protein
MYGAELKRALMRVPERYVQLGGPKRLAPPASPASSAPASDPSLDASPRAPESLGEPVR